MNSNLKYIATVLEIMNYCERYKVTKRIVPIYRKVYKELEQSIKNNKEWRPFNEDNF